MLDNAIDGAVHPYSYLIHSLAFRELPFLDPVHTPGLLRNCYQHTAELFDADF